jgi:hypothetical protein
VHPAWSRAAVKSASPGRWAGNRPAVVDVSMFLKLSSSTAASLARAGKAGTACPSSRCGGAANKHFFQRPVGRGRPWWPRRGSTSQEVGIGQALAAILKFGPAKEACVCGCSINTSESRKGSFKQSEKVTSGRSRNGVTRSPVKARRTF